PKNRLLFYVRNTYVTTIKNPMSQSLLKMIAYDENKQMHKQTYVFSDIFSTFKQYFHITYRLYVPYSHAFHSSTVSRVSIILCYHNIFLRPNTYGLHNMIAFMTMANFDISNNLF